MRRVRRSPRRHPIGALTERWKQRSWWGELFKNPAAGEIPNRGENGYESVMGSGLFFCGSWNVTSPLGRSRPLRVLFSRLGKPHIGSSNAFSFNVPSVRAVGSRTVEKGPPRSRRR